jgi:HAD superfamily hydrolase (TIGR01509 family)
MPSDLAGLDAVLLDMDGTLVDTEGLWWAAAAAVAASLGRPLGPADLPHVHGRTIEDVARHLLGDDPGAQEIEDARHLLGDDPGAQEIEDARHLLGDDPGAQEIEDARHLLGDDPGAQEIEDARHLLGDGPGRQEVIGRLTDAFADRVEREVTLMPGASELLAGLAATAVPTALVSASPRSIVELVLPRLGHAFDLVIANEDTVRGKPYPDPYLEAARRLGAAPRRCVAIEDSPAGIAAATAAGCHVLVAGPERGLPTLDRLRASFR